MKTADELMAIIAKLREEPAPGYIYDECGIAHHAIQLRNLQRDEEWWMEYEDEVPY